MQLNNVNKWNLVVKYWKSFMLFSTKVLIWLWKVFDLADKCVFGFSNGTNLLQYFKEIVIKETKIMKNKCH